jgi:hypothetical protein
LPQAFQSGGVVVGRLVKDVGELKKKALVNMINVLCFVCVCVEVEGDLGDIWRDVYLWCWVYKNGQRTMLGILYGWRKGNKGEVFEERSVKAALVELPQGTAHVSIRAMLQSKKKKPRS